MQERPTQRALCGVCLRAKATCICHWIRPVRTHVEVLILQHPLEVVHVKNSGRLLHLSLPNSRLLVGEAFDAPELPAKNTLLLYPAEMSNGHLRAAELPDLNAQEAVNLRLVVLDATWRKSRKMLHVSPWLQQLPRLALDAGPVSRYTIRKAHRPGQLSTLEASCLALMQLDCAVGGVESLLQAFDGFVAQQQAYRPSA